MNEDLPTIQPVQCHLHDGLECELNDDENGDQWLVNPFPVIQPVTGTKTFLYHCYYCDDGHSCYCSDDVILFEDSCEVRSREACDGYGSSHQHRNCRGPGFHETFELGCGLFPPLQHGRKLEWIHPLPQNFPTMT